MKIKALLEVFSRVKPKCRENVFESCVKSIFALTLYQKITKCSHLEKYFLCLYNNIYNHG